MVGGKDTVRSFDEGLVDCSAVHKHPNSARVPRS